MNADILRTVHAIISIADEGSDTDFLAIRRGARSRGYPSVISYDIAGAKYLSMLLSESELRRLIVGLIKYSQAAGRSKSGGSASPVIPLFHEYIKLYPAFEPELSAWIVENRVNSYEPFGTHNDYGAKSITEYISRKSAARAAQR